MKDTGNDGTATSGKTLEILIVDDELTLQKLLAEALDIAGYEVTLAGDGASAIEMVQRTVFDLVFLDVNMPDMDGLQTLEKIRDIDSEVTVAMLTGFGSIETAVEAIKRGASEYFLKPFSLPAVMRLVTRVEKRRTSASSRPAGRSRDANGRGRLVVSDPVMQKTVDFVDRIAPLPSTVLIEGESGTGKELIARRIHDRSARADHRYIAFNCAVVPQHLFESELFGHEKGSFTGADSRKIGLFEAAEGGTLFIDEISEMSPEMQTKLLRVLQERAFRRVGGIDEIPADVRVIAATNRNLEHEVAEDRFRKDLFYRINVLKVRVPALRERPRDIPVLCKHFIELFRNEMGVSISGIEQAAMEQLQRYRWDGNVRELQNVIESAVAVAEGQSITLSDLPEVLTHSGSQPRHREPGIERYQEAKLEFETHYLSKAMKEADGNVALAARMTGISRQHLYEKLSQLGIEQTEFRRREAGGAA